MIYVLIYVNESEFQAPFISDNMEICIYMGAYTFEK